MAGFGLRGRGAERLRGRKVCFVAQLLLACSAVVMAQNSGDTALADALYRNSTALQARLLDGYQKGILPKGGVQVSMQLSLYQIVNIDTAQQTMQILGWWRRFWKDERLSWDAELWGVDALIFSVDQIWLPDDLIYEAVSETPLGTQLASAYPDGSVYISAPKVSTISCPMKLKAFPYDNQNCVFTVGSMAHDGTQIDLVVRDVAEPDKWFLPSEEYQEKTGIDLQEYVVNPEFGLRQVRVTSKNIFYNCCVNPYPVIVFSFGIARQTFTYETGIIIPLILVTFVGFGALLMPAPLSGARPALSVSIMFTTASIYFVASNKMPDIGTDTLIGRLYMYALVSAMIMTFVSIMSTSFNLVTTEDKAQTQQLMAMFRHFDADKSGELDPVEAEHALNSLGLSSAERRELLSSCNLNSKENISTDDWLRLARVAKKYRGTTQDNVFSSGVISLIHRVSGHRENFEGSAESTGGALPTPSRQTAVAGGNFGKHQEPDDDRYSDGDIEMTMNDDTVQENAREHIEHFMKQLEHEHRSPSHSNGIAETNGNHTFPDLLAKWFHLLQVPDSVLANFRREGVDAEALKNMTKEELKSLGVNRMGARAKLLLWAAQERSSRSSSVCDDKPDRPNNNPALSLPAVLVDDEQIKSPVPGNVQSPNTVVPVKRMNSLTKAESILRKPFEATKAVGKGFSRHLGSTLDFWSLCIWPTVFVIYLLIEFTQLEPDTGGAFTNRNTTRIVFVDERHSSGSIMCHANYQAVSPSEIKNCAHLL